MRCGLLLYLIFIFPLIGNFYLVLKIMKGFYAAFCVAFRLIV
ncbi:hypothetical protein HMPREF1548_04077 [Clostridium sp. KLE 1755]|nr:hypothetical protein HMPREF1548_04077 [Clostridium sp. KLE 1755]